MKGNKYVLEVKEFIKTPNNFYLVMQLCNGDNLQKFIKNSFNPKKSDPCRPIGLPPVVVRGIMFQITDAFV
jgi:serine/threonine protein kinase